MIMITMMRHFTIKKAVDPKGHEARVTKIGKCWTWDGDGEVVDVEYDNHDDDNDHDHYDNLPSIRQ